MKCEDCRYYVGDEDPTTDCYEESCPYIDRDVEDDDWKYEYPRFSIFDE